MQTQFDNGVGLYNVFIILNFIPHRFNNTHTHPLCDTQCSGWWIMHFVSVYCRWNIVPEPSGFLGFLAASDIASVLLSRDA